MSYEPKNLLGALFKNDKEGNEHRPDYKGDCCINGVEYQIGAWLKEGKKGKFMSLKFEAKKRQDVSSEIPATNTGGGVRASNAAQPAKPQTVPEDSFDDDIPF
jgi:hypothetical protein